MLRVVSEMPSRIQTRSELALSMPRRHEDHQPRRFSRGNVCSELLQLRANVAVDPTCLIPRVEFENEVDQMPTLQRAEREFLKFRRRPGRKLSLKISLRVCCCDLFIFTLPAVFRLRFQAYYPLLLRFRSQFLQAWPVLGQGLLLQ